MAPVHARPILKQLYRYFEVQNLKAILRAVIIDPSWEARPGCAFPDGRDDRSACPGHAGVWQCRRGDRAFAKHSVLRHITSWLAKRYSAEQNLFPLEVALDLYYWRQLWSEAKKLPGQDRVQATKIIGSMDVNNLMWVIRYKVYHGLSEEEIINYTLPFGYRCLG